MREQRASGPVRVVFLGSGSSGNASAIAWPGGAVLVVGDLALNPDTHEVTRGDRVVELTQREFELLEYLMRNERIVVPRQRLLEEVWGYRVAAGERTVDSHVRAIRRKLGPDVIRTRHGIGYALDTNGLG